MILRNPRYEKFAQAIVKGTMRQTEAYERAGFAARGHAASRCAVRLLEHPEVAARIAELRDEALAKYRLNRRELLDYLVDVIETPAGQVKEGDRLCHSYRKTAQQRSTRMPDKLKAAEMLAKLCGWFAPEKQEHSGDLEVMVTIVGDDSDPTKPAPEPKRIVEAKNAMLRKVRQEKFAQEVAAGKQQARAYEEAGFEPKPENSHRATWRLMKNPAVKDRIAELQREAAAECRITRQQLLDFLVEVMLTPAGEVQEDHRLCQAFRFTEKTQWMWMPDKLRAAELVIRIHGWDEPEKAAEEPIVIKIGGE